MTDPATAIAFGGCLLVVAGIASIGVLNFQAKADKLAAKLADTEFRLFDWKQSCLSAQADLNAIKGHLSDKEHEAFIATERAERAEAKLALITQPRQKDGKFAAKSRAKAIAHTLEALSVSKLLPREEVVAGAYEGARGRVA